MTMPRELNGIQSRVINDFTDPFTIGPIIKNRTASMNFSPRIGIAYDLFGNGKTAIRAAFGKQSTTSGISAPPSSRT